MANRNDYLRQLNQMRNNYQNSGNPMINPMDDSTNVGEELSSFTYMQTQPKEASNHKRAVDTILGTSMGTNVNHGVLNWVDDMWDFTVATFGSLESGAKAFTDALFGMSEGDTFKERFNTSWSASEKIMQNLITTDWQAPVENVMNQVNLVGHLLNGDMFDGTGHQDSTWAQNWRAVGDLKASRQAITEQEHTGYLQDKEIAFGYNVGQIEQGIGYILPSIIIGYFTGGSSIAAQAAIQGGVAFGGAMGSAVEQATNEGADYGNAVGYGASKGAIAGTIAAATTGIGGNIAQKSGSGLTGQLTGKIGQAIGNKATNEVAQKTITTVVGKSTEILARAGIASLSAAANTALDPVLKQIYDDEAIEKAYGSEIARSETWKKCQAAMASAAIISIATSVGREGVDIVKSGGFSNYADKYMNQQSAIYAKRYEKMSKQMNKELIANKDNPQQAEKIIARYTNQFNKLTNDYELALTHTEQMARLTNYNPENTGAKDNAKQATNILKYVQHTTQGNQAIASKLLENKDFKAYFSNSEVKDNQANFYSQDKTKMLSFNNKGQAYLTVKGNTEKSSFTVPVEMSKNGTMQIIVSTEKALGHTLDLIGNKNNGFKFDTSILLKKDTLDVPQTLSTKVNNSEGLEIKSSTVAKWADDFRNDVKEYFEVAKENKGKVVYKDEETGKYKVIERYTDDNGEQKVAIITTDKGFKLVEDINISKESESPITAQDTEIKVDKSTLVPMTEESEVPNEQKLIPLDNEINVKIGNNKPYHISDTFIFKSENEDKSIGNQQLNYYLEKAKGIPTKDTYISKDGKHIYQVSMVTSKDKEGLKNKIIDDFIKLSPKSEVVDKDIGRENVEKYFDDLSDERKEKGQTLEGFSVFKKANVDKLLKAVEENTNIETDTNLPLVMPRNKLAKSVYIKKNESSFIYDVIYGDLEPTYLIKKVGNKTELAFENSNAKRGYTSLILELNIVPEKDLIEVNFVDSLFSRDNFDNYIKKQEVVRLKNNPLVNNSLTQGKGNATIKPLVERKSEIDSTYGTIKIEGEKYHLSDIENTVSVIQSFTDDYSNYYSEGNDYVEPYIKKRYVSKVNESAEKLLDFFKGEVHDFDETYDLTTDDIDLVDIETIKLVQGAGIDDLIDSIDTLIGEIDSCEYPNGDSPDYSSMEALRDYLDTYREEIGDFIDEYNEAIASKQIPVETPQNSVIPQDEKVTYLTYDYDTQTNSLIGIIESKNKPNYHLGQNGVTKVSTMSEIDVNSSARFISAKGNLEKKQVISLKDTREVVKQVIEELPKLVAGEGGEVKLNTVPARNKEIFTVLNTGSDEQVNQTIDIFLDKLLDSEITYYKGTEFEQTIKLRDYSPKELESIKDDLGSVLKELINAKSQPSKMLKTIDKYEDKLEKQEQYFEGRIEKLVDKYNNAIDRFNDYKARHKQSLQLKKQSEKIVSTMEKKHTYGLAEQDNIIKNNVLKLARLSTFKDGVYSASKKQNFAMLAADEGFMASLEGDSSLYQNGKRIAELIREIAGTYDANANKQEPFTLEELRLVDEFQKESLKAFDFTSKKQQEIRPVSQELSNQITFAQENGATYYKGNVGKNAVEYVADPSHTAVRIFGSRESEGYKRLVDNGVKCASNVMKDNAVLASKYKANKDTQIKLSRKENITLSNGVTVSQRHLCYMYAQMIVKENADHLQGTGSIELGKGKFKRTVPFKYSTELLAEIEEKISPEAKAKAVAIHKFLNEELSPYLKAHGVETVDDYMIEITSRLARADNVNRLGGKSYTATSNNLKTRTSKILPAHITTFEEVIPNLINSVVTEINFNDYVTDMNYLLNLDLSGEGEGYTSVSTALKGLDSNSVNFIKGMMASFVGVDPNAKPEKIPVVDYVVNQTMAAKVGLNFFSTALKQPISIFYAFETLDQKSFWKAMGTGKFIKAFGDSVIYHAKHGKVTKELQGVFDESGLLMTRGNAAIKGNQLNEKGTVNAVAKFAGLSMSLTDMTSVSFLTYTALEQAKSELPNGTQAEINYRAAEIMDQVLQRQVNNYSWNVSRLQHNPLGKFIAAYKAQGRSMLSMVADLVSESAYVKQTLPKAESAMSSAKARAESATNEKEKARAEQDYKKAESAYKQAKATQAKLGKRGRAVVSMLISSGVFMTLIPLLTQRLYGKKKWNEKEDMKSLGMDFAYNTFVSWIPVVSTMADGLYPALYKKVTGQEKYYETPNLLFEGYEDITNVYNNIMSLSDNPSKAEIASIINDIAVFTAKMFGIPLENIEKQLYGIAKNFNIEKMIKFQNLLYGYSSTYLSRQVKENAAADPKEANIYLSQEMALYKTGTSDDNVNAEIIRLYSVDESYSCIPSDSLKSYKDEKGETVELTDSQRQAFKEAYAQSTSAVKELISLTEYSSQNDQNKAKMIKSVYDAYYQYAKYQAIGKQGSTKLSRLLIATKGGVGITKYLIGINALSDIKATKFNDRKTLVIKQINSMKNFDKNEKMLLLYLCGYSISDENKIMLTRYLQRLGMSKKEANEFLS